MEYKLYWPFLIFLLLRIKYAIDQKGWIVRGSYETTSLYSRTLASLQILKKQWLSRFANIDRKEIRRFCSILAREHSDWGGGLGWSVPFQTGVALRMCSASLMQKWRKDTWKLIKYWNFTSLWTHTQKMWCKNNKLLVCRFEEDANPPQLKIDYPAMR